MKERKWKEERKTKNLTFNDLATADGEFEGLSAVAGRVELVAVGQRARVMHLHLLTILGIRSAISGLVSFDLKDRKINQTKSRVLETNFLYS